MLIAFGAMAAILLAPSLGTGARSGGGPASPPASAAKILSIDTTAGLELSLWQWTTSAGGRCATLHFSAEKALVPPRRANGGGACDIGRPVPQQDRVLATITWVPYADRVRAFVDGRLAPELAGARVTLETPAGEVGLASRGRNFLGELPIEAVATMGVLEAGPYVVRVRARAENEAALDLNELVERATPPAEES